MIECKVSLQYPCYPDSGLRSSGLPVSLPSHPIRESQHVKSQLAAKHLQAWIEKSTCSGINDRREVGTNFPAAAQNFGIQRF